jgi:LDH2 family malate/lactate/ureidoglycolate dehydrogenase
MAFKVSDLMPADSFKARVDRSAEEIREFPRAPGMETIHLPRDTEYESERERKILSGDATTNDLLALAHELHGKEEFP